MYVKTLNDSKHGVLLFLYDSSKYQKNNSRFYKARSQCENRTVMCFWFVASGFKQQIQGVYILYKPENVCCVTAKRIDD